MRRFELTEAEYDRIAHLLPGKAEDSGFKAIDNRRFLDAVLWIARTGAPWRDLPDRFGNFNTVFQRFRRWAVKGTWKRIFEELQDPDLEWAFMDSTTIRGHIHAAGAENSTAEKEDLGRGCGGFSTKIHAVVDALGNPVRIILSPGQDHDVTYAEELIEDLDAQAVIGDKGYDSDKLIETIESTGAEAIIPPKKNRIVKREYDKHIYKIRNTVERFFGQIKQLRRVATRYEKTASSFLGMVHLGCLMILLK